MGCLPVDQRGLTRGLNDRCDIGAYDYDALGGVEPPPSSPGPAITKYYQLGDQKIALRQVQDDGSSQVFYTIGDHLGSTSLTTADSGDVVAESRYYPYGEVRWSFGEEQSEFGFTSQREERGFQLYDYNARYFSPVLGRFVSPDSIVPEPSTAGGFNRYRYARNSPLMFTDPTGHCPWCLAAVGLAGVALLISTDQPMNDEIATKDENYRNSYPSTEQGMTGATLLIAPLSMGAISLESSKLAGTNALGYMQTAKAGAIAGGISSGVGHLAGSAINYQLTGEPINLGDTVVATTNGAIWGLVSPTFGQTKNGGAALGLLSSSTQYIGIQLNNGRNIEASGLTENALTGLVLGGLTGVSPARKTPTLGSGFYKIDDPIIKQMNIYDEFSIQSNAILSKESILLGTVGLTAGNLDKSAVNNCISYDKCSPH